MSTKKKKKPIRHYAVGTLNFPSGLSGRRVDALLTALINADIFYPFDSATDQWEWEADNVFKWLELNGYVVNNATKTVVQKEKRNVPRRQHRTK